MTALVLYPLLTAWLFYLGCAARATEPIWSRYPERIMLFMQCAACTGFWYGAGVAALGGYALGLDFLALPGDRPETIALAACASGVWTPLVALLHLSALDRLGGDEE